MKNFDDWNGKKKNIDLEKNKFFKERDVWWCSLGINVGFEQDGKGEHYERPVLVVKALSKNTCLIIPITSSESENKNRIYIGMIEDKKCSAITSQLRVLDSRRFTDKISRVDKETFEIIKEALRNMF